MFPALGLALASLVYNRIKNNKTSSSEPIIARAGNWSGTGATGDFFTMDFDTVAKTLTYTNMSFPERTGIVTYTDGTGSESGFLKFPDNSGGFLFGLLIPDLGFFGASDKLGGSGSQKGLVFAVKSLPFTPTALVGKSFNFYSFCPPTAYVREKGMVFGWVNFTSVPNGARTESGQFVLGMNPVAEGNAYNFGNQFNITTSDVNPNDTSIVTIGSTAYKPQLGATAFLSPFGFVLDYAEGYNGNDAFDAGNLVGFPKADQSAFYPFYAGTYKLIVFAYENVTWKYEDGEFAKGTVPQNATKVFKGKVTITSRVGQQTNPNGCTLSTCTLDLSNNGTFVAPSSDTIEGPYQPFTESDIDNTYSASVGDNVFQNNHCEGTFINIDTNNRDNTTIVFNGKDASPASKSIMISYVKRSSDTPNIVKTYTIWYAYGVSDVS
jgi:hypothetical protein